MIKFIGFLIGVYIILKLMDYFFKYYLKPVLEYLLELLKNSW